jgi:ParB/RepB/Spo0J family partition protein
MTEERKTPDNPAPQATAPPPRVQTRMLTIRLRELDDPAQQQDEYANRFAEKYAPAKLPDLVESFKLRGLIEPLQVVRGPDGKWRIVAGHRRTAALFLMARQNVPGFSLDMDVPVIEVQDASIVDLLARSIITNELGERLDVKERLLATKKLDEAGASKREIAAAFRISEKQVERDLRVTRNPRLLQHVLDDHLTSTMAAALAEVAAKENQLDEFLDYFDGLVARTKGAITDDDRRSKTETGKGLRPAQMVVVNRLESHVIRGWIDALAKGNPLTEEPDLGFLAVFDKKTAVAEIKLKVDARDAPVDHIARVASQVSQIARRLAAFAQKRAVLESPEGPQGALQQDDSFLDMDLLRQFDLEGQVELDLHQEGDLLPGPQTEQTEAKDGK